MDSDKQKLFLSLKLFNKFIVLISIDMGNI